MTFDLLLPFRPTPRTTDLCILSARKPSGFPGAAGTSHNTQKPITFDPPQHRSIFSAIGVLPLSVQSNRVKREFQRPPSFRANVALTRLERSAADLNIPQSARQNGGRLPFLDERDWMRLDKSDGEKFRLSGRPGASRRDEKGGSKPTASFTPLFPRTHVKMTRR